MNDTELHTLRDVLQDGAQMYVCNREAGSFSQLWGRDCWIADSVLSLIQVAIDEEMHRDDPTDPLWKVWQYCEQLREKNRMGEFPDTIGS